MASPWFDDLSVLEEDACDDDDDDSSESWTGPDYRVRLQPAMESRTCKLLVICNGTTACCYGDSYLLEEANGDKEVGRIERADDSSVHGRLCKYSDEVIVCLCQREVPPEASRIWTKKVLGVVHPEQVVLLASYQAMRFLSEVNLLDSMPLLRCVATTAWSRDSLPCPFLESPNTVIGCQAAVLTHCEMENIPAAAFLLVESRADVDIEGLQLFLEASHTPALRPLIGKMANQPQSEVTSVLRRILPPPSIYSTMFA